MSTSNREETAEVLEDIRSEQDLRDFIETQIQSADLRLLFDAINPLNYPDTRTVSREIATALMNGDGDALVLAQRDYFMDYMRRAAGIQQRSYPSPEPPFGPFGDDREITCQDNDQRADDQ